MTHQEIQHSVELVNTERGPDEVEPPIRSRRATVGAGGRCTSAGGQRLMSPEVVCWAL